MDIVQIRIFFMWCTIINTGMLLLSFAILSIAGDWVYRMHTRWFPMPREAFNITIYAMLGWYKMAFLLLCFVPYIALVIME
ncbi:MAG: DUF6868 family protein [Acidobacteriota bacterium]